MFRQGTFEEIEAQKTIRSKDSFCLKRMPRLEEPMRAGSGVEDQERLPAVRCSWQARTSSIPSRSGDWLK